MYLIKGLDCSFAYRTAFASSTQLNNAEPMHCVLRKMGDNFHHCQAALNGVMLIHNIFAPCFLHPLFNS